MKPEIHNINGCLVALYKMESVKAVMVQAIVKFGSINENGPNWGAVHLMEHMSMDSSVDFPSQENLEIFKEDNGIRTGAWTGPFSMGYWFKFPSINIKEGLKLVDQIMFNPLLRIEDKVRETKIIEQEYVDAWSSPKRRFSKEIKRQLYGKDHPFLRDGMGQPEYIKSLDLKAIQSLHKKIIFPSNMVMSVVGNFDKKELLKLFSNILGTKKNSTVSAPFLPPPSPESHYLHHTEKGDRVEIVYQWLGPGRDTLSMKDRIAIGIARYMLGGSNRSFLQKRLRGEHGLVYACGSGVSFTPISSVFEVGASTSKDRAPLVSKEMNKVVDFVLEGNLSETQFERSRKFMDMQTLMLYDSVDNISNDLANSLFWEKRTYTPDEMVSVANKITLTDIKNIYKSYFSNKRYISVMADKKIQPIKK